MWGNGVIGAMRMEELGAKGRVHVSNTTAALLNGSLPLENAQVAGSISPGLTCALPKFCSAVRCPVWCIQHALT